MEKCKECGWIHPPVVGPCPAAKLKKMHESEKGKTITNFVSDLSDALYSSEDWEKNIRLIKSMLKMK